MTQTETPIPPGESEITFVCQNCGHSQLMKTNSVYPPVTETQQVPNCFRCNPPPIPGA